MKKYVLKLELEDTNIWRRLSNATKFAKIFY